MDGVLDFYCPVEENKSVVVSEPSLTIKLPTPKGMSNEEFASFLEKILGGKEESRCPYMRNNIVQENVKN